MIRAYRVTGVVQGVGFRWFTQKAATRLGLRGTVRNAPDGSVEVIAEGNPEALEALADALRDGPGGAVVETVQEIPPAGGPLPGDFRIVR